MTDNIHLFGELHHAKYGSEKYKTGRVTITSGKPNIKAVRTGTVWCPIYRGKCGRNG